MDGDAFGRTVEDGSKLVFALCHEISNLVAAVRLQAHLIDEDLDARGLAVASLEIDDLSARCAALLALVRPLLSEAPAEAAPIGAGVIASNFERALTEYGGRAFEIEFDVPESPPEISAEPEVFHYLLLSQAYGAMEAMDGLEQEGSLRVGVRVTEKEVVFVIEDVAPEDSQHLEWWDAALRGRALECAIANHVLQKRGARFDVRRHEGRNRTEIAAPRR